MLKRDGRRMNLKKVYRLYKEEPPCANAAAASVRWASERDKKSRRAPFSSSIDFVQDARSNGSASCVVSWQWSSLGRRDRRRIALHRNR
jgi:hypothetical protein